MLQFERDFDTSPKYEDIKHFLFDVVELLKFCLVDITAAIELNVNRAELQV